MMVRKRKGYTLIEVLMAVVILAFVLPGVVIMVVNSRKVQNQSLRFEAGAAAAQRLIDELTMLPAQATGISGTKTINEGGVSYNLSWTRTPYTSSSGGTPLGGSRLVVDVQWTVGGTSHSTQMIGVAP